MTTFHSTKVALVAGSVAAGVAAANAHVVRAAPVVQPYPRRVPRSLQDAERMLAAQAKRDARNAKRADRG